MPLGMAVRLWPTPTAHLAKEGGFPAEGRRNTPSLTWEMMQAELAATKRLWPTPNASDHRDRGGASRGSIQRRKEKGKQISLSMSVDGQLNPVWVEWLMGFPTGWTDLEDSETQ